MSKIREDIKEYYGKILKNKEELKTSACCSSDGFPLHIRNILSNIEREVLDKFYGCGSPIPDVLDGRVVLDLGCGTGRDVYIISKLVGESGHVIGVDMTDEQLAVANKYLDLQTKRFGFKKPNVTFKKGYIEDLRSIGIEDNSVDVVISNCVLNLSYDKKEAFKEIFRVLKPGGELYFSDIFSGRRIPKEYCDDPVLYGECLSGAMYTEDFRRLLMDLGCPDHRVISSTRLSLNNKEIEDKIGMIDFYSMTIRVFNLVNLEDICEDYGQVATYNGLIDNCPHFFDLDDHHRFITGKPMLVCGNTASMLHETRFTKYFNIVGDRSIHYGPFDCSSPNGQLLDNVGGACC